MKKIFLITSVILFASQFGINATDNDMQKYFETKNWKSEEIQNLKQVGALKKIFPSLYTKGAFHVREANCLKLTEKHIKKEFKEDCANCEEEVKDLVVRALSQIKGEFANKETMTAAFIYGLISATSFVGALGTYCFAQGTIGAPIGMFGGTALGVIGTVFTGMSLHEAHNESKINGVIDAVQNELVDVEKEK